MLPTSNHQKDLHSTKNVKLTKFTKREPTAGFPVGQALNTLAFSGKKKNNVETNAKQFTKEKVLQIQSTELITISVHNICIQTYKNMHLLTFLAVQNQYIFYKQLLWCEFTVLQALMSLGKETW